MLDYRLIDLFPHLSAWAPIMPDYRLADLILVALVLVLMPAYSVASARKLARTPRNELHLVGRYWTIIARAILVSLLILLTWHWSGRPYAALGLDTNISLPGRLGFGVDVLLACYFAYALLLQKLSAEKLAAVQEGFNNMRISPQTRAEFAVFPFVILFGSTMEELLYRGYLFWAFTPIAGLWGAVLISSAAFGLAHAYQGWSGILRTMLVGLAFATGFALTHSLWWLMLTHIMLNMYGALYARKVNRLAPAPQ